MKKPKKKVSKVVMLRRLKKLGDKLWSEYIRGRDGKCMICGAKDKLQAHHCIIRKALSNLTRYDKDNGITLCYICHLIEIHGNATKTILETYLAVLNKMYTKEQQEGVVSRSKERRKLEVEDLQKIVDDLKQSIKDLKETPKQEPPNENKIS